MARTRQKCRRCEELEAELRRVKAELAELREQLSKLMKNSSNSSKPPSSDIINPSPDGGKKNEKSTGLGQAEGAGVNLATSGMSEKPSSRMKSIVIGNIG